MRLSSQTAVNSGVPLPLDNCDVTKSENINNSEDVSSTNVSFISGMQETFDKCEHYKEIILPLVEEYLMSNGYTPTDKDFSLLQKTYNEGDFLCEKQDGWFGSSYIVKENTDFAEVVVDALCGMQPEKIIEEYKDGKITKQTHYNKDGSYEIINYKKDGSISDKSEFNFKSTMNSGIKAEIKITYYEKECSTVYTKSFELNDKCENDECIIEDDISCYDKDGKYDVVSTLFVASLYNITYDLIEDAASNLSES